jgi:hypothetical protein
VVLVLGAGSENGKGLALGHLAATRRGAESPAEGVEHEGQDDEHDVGNTQLGPRRPERGSATAFPWRERGGVLLCTAYERAP